MAMNTMVFSKVFKAIVGQRCESNIPDLSEGHENTNQEKADQYQNLVCGLVSCITSQSTAKVILGGSFHLSTLFSWVSLTKHLTSTSCTDFRACY